MEYEVAAELKSTLQELSGREFVRKIAGLIGQDPKLPEPVIDPSPLEEVKEPPSFDSLVLIGGPLRNQVTKFYAEQEPLLKFDSAHTAYLERVGGSYHKVEEPDIVAILVKLIVGEQTVITVFGNGEMHTQSAVRYLMENWRKLNQQYPHLLLGVCLSVDQNCKAKAQKIIAEQVGKRQ